MATSARNYCFFRILRRKLGSDMKDSKLVQKWTMFLGKSENIWQLCEKLHVTWYQRQSSFISLTIWKILFTRNWHRHCWIRVKIWWVKQSNISKLRKHWFNWFILKLGGQVCNGSRTSWKSRKEAETAGCISKCFGSYSYVFLMYRFWIDMYLSMSEINSFPNQIGNIPMNQPADPISS